MVTLRCKHCGATGVKFYTHGKSSKAKGGLVHNKNCSKKNKKISRRKRNV